MKNLEDIFELLPDRTTFLGTDAVDLIEHDTLETRGPDGREGGREEHAAGGSVVSKQTLR